MHELGLSQRDAAVRIDQQVPVGRRNERPADGKLIAERRLLDGETVPSPWRTIVVAAGERTTVALSARLMQRADAGICWRLDAVP